ncbi:MAG: hemerythrin domain-containing protein [Betaproteobacteria bacterium]
MSVFEKVRATLGAYGESDVRSLLHDDHETIRKLAKELAETDSATRRKSVLRELKPFLTAHSRSEEAAVYTPLMELRNSPDSRLAGNEGMVEHNLADIVVERLANTTDASTDMWRAHARVLHEALEHHIKEEEGKMFEELGEHFSEEEREAMGLRFIAGKEKLLKPAAAKTPLRKRAIAASA